MPQSMAVLGLAMFVLVTATPVSGESKPEPVDESRKTVYKWVDGDGTVHFSDDKSTIPSEYWPSVIESDVKRPRPDWNRSDSYQPKKSTGDKKKSNSRGEQYWSELQASLVDRHNDTVDQYEVAAMSLARARTTGQPPAAVIQAEETLSKLRGEIERLRGMLQRLPDSVAIDNGASWWIDDYDELTLKRRTDE